MRGRLYILANKRNGTLYVGVTSSLRDRVQQHKEGLQPGFTSRYGVKRLVYCEQHSSIAQAIQREANIKHLPRRWKLEPIEQANPEWRDLSEDTHLL
jgi:putative endonuclease